MDEWIKKPRSGRHAPRVYAVTGQSGSGKSLFAKMLAERLGCEHVDIDTIGHMATEDPQIIERIRDAFGEGVMNEDGTVNRKAVGEIVFASKEKMAVYTDITWEYMRSVLDRRIRNAEGAIVLEWVLLPISGKYWRRAYPKILVKADDAARKKAVLERDGISSAYFDQRDAASLPFGRYKFDYIVENDYTRETFLRAIDRITD